MRYYLQDPQDLAFVIHRPWERFPDWTLDKQLGSLLTSEEWAVALRGYTPRQQANALTWIYIPEHDEHAYLADLKRLLGVEKSNP